MKPSKVERRVCGGVIIIASYGTFQYRD